MDTWDATKVKSQIRLAAYRLAQLRERHNQTSNITKSDIATLIGQGNIDVARSKVERLIRDDRLGALLEGLESYCKVLLERFTELDGLTSSDSYSAVVEAVCGLIVAGPHTELKDVVILSELFQHKYGTKFTRLATQNHGNVPSHIIDTISKRPPPSAQIDVYMVSIAKAYQLDWSPPMLPHQKAHALSGILDQSSFPPIVNLEELRHICAQGVPQQPPWLRPRIWKLLLGTLPPQKDSWETEAHSKRQSYYALARRLLSSMQTLPPPTTPLTPLDASLHHLEKSLFPLPREFDEELELSPLCPFDANAPEGLRIDAADAVNERLKLIRNHVAGADSVIHIPDIQISVTAPPESPADVQSNRTRDVTLDSPVSAKSHSTSLLRLLYIHVSLHPSIPIAYITSVLIPLYATMIQEVEPAELAHIEADSFWLLVEVWGEVGELAEKEDSREWMVKFGKRLAYADPELWDDLCHKGLDPALPHYSYRWLAPLLTRTLSRQAVLTIWDALFTRPSRTSDHNPKLEFLLDICTSMLIHARVRLFRLGKEAPKSPGLWGDMEVTISVPSSAPIASEEGFVQGMALLQNYPVEEFGGPERIIDTALGLYRQRECPDQKSVQDAGFGEKLRGSMLSGFITRAKSVEDPIPEEDVESDGTPSPEWPDSGAEDGDVSQPSGDTFLSKIGDTVWRGITNKSSMDVPPSPLPPSTPIQPASPAITQDGLPLPDPSSTDPVGIGRRIGSSIWRGITNQSAMDDPPSPIESRHSSGRPDIESIASPRSPSTLWNYTEKIKDSNAAATLSKVSTNWSAKAAALWGGNYPSSTVSSPDAPAHKYRSASLSLTGNSWSELFPKRGSLPSQHINEYIPPPRPNFRESRYFSPGEYSTPGSPPQTLASLPSPPDLLTKGKVALASLTKTSTPKTGPRPLFLNSSSLITPSGPRRPSRSPTPVSRSPPQRDSISSASSASTSDMQQTTYSDRELEPTNAGRLVPLRRGGPTKTTQSEVVRSAARTRNAQHLAPSNESEPTRSSFAMGSSSKDPERRTSSEESARRGWGRVELPDSPSTLPSSPPPGTPITFTNSTNIRINDGTSRQQRSMGLSEPVELAQTPQVEKKIARKKSWNTAVAQPVSPLGDGDNSSTSQENHSHVRNKRHARPTNLRLKSDPDMRRSSPTIIEQKSSGDTMTLMPENVADAISTTPRATDFPDHPGRLSRPRRLSRSPRRLSRKSSVSVKWSGGEEGDDEGYDDFLSAYESEDLEGKTAP